MMTRKKKPQNIRRGRLTAAVCAFIFFAVPASGSALAWSDHHRLGHWIDKDLSPYLAEKLSRHPRFKGESVAFAGMEGERLREDIDDLTRDIIATLRSNLQKVHGVQLAWQGERNEEVPCHQLSEPEYRIGIDVSPLPAQRYRVTVRALDVRERSWVSGFGREWEGTLSRAQRVALGRRDAGGELLGLRAYPYSEAQIDLLAKHLASTLSRGLCGFVGDALRVYPDASDDELAVVNRTLELIGRHLASDQDLTIVSNEEQANVRLTARAVPIDGGLHQLWVGVEPLQQDLALPDINSQAYVQLRERSRVAASPPLAAPPVVSVPARTQREHRSASGLLASIRVVTPMDARNCRSADPWRFGQGVASGARRVALDGCFAFDITTRRDARVYLIEMDDRHGPVRLLPSSCRTFGRIRTALRGGESLRFPSPDAGRLHALHAPGRGGNGAFYVVAAADRRAADRIDDHLAELADACSAGSAHADGSGDWLRALSRTIADLGERAELERIEVNYVPRARTLARGD